MPWSGKFRRISVRIAVFGGAVGGGDGIEAARTALVLDASSAVRKNGRMVSPETEASSFTKAAKVDRRHAARPHSSVAPSTYRRPAERGNRLWSAVTPAGAVRQLDRGSASARPVKRPGTGTNAGRGRRGPGAAVLLVATLDLDLYRQPVPAQFDRRYRAGTWRGELGLSPVEIGLLSSIRLLHGFAAFSSILGRYGRSTASASSAWLFGGVAVTVVGTAVFAAAENAGGPDSRARSARARHGESRW